MRVYLMGHTTLQQGSKLEFTLTVAVLSRFHALFHSFTRWFPSLSTASELKVWPGLGGNEDCASALPKA